MKFKKKVLFIAYNFPPQGGGGVLRSLKFVKYLPSFGWEPVVITCKKPDYGICDESLLRQIPEKINIKRTYSLTPFKFFKILKKTGLSRLRVILDYYLFIPDKLIGWVPFVYFCAKKIIKSEKIDAIFTTSPPHSSHFAGILLKKKFPALKLVTDFRDAWCENPFRNVARNSIRAKIEEKMERMVFKHSDRIIFNTSSSMNLYINKYGELIKSKSEAVHNGYDHDDFTGIKRQAGREKFVILHTGDIYGIRSIAPFLKALEALLSEIKGLEDRIIVKFVGYSIKSDEQKRVAQSPAGKIIDFVSFVPHADCIELMLNSDLLLLITGKDENKVMIPSKFYEYLASGTKILALSEKGELTRILENCRAGDWASSEDTVRIKEILKSQILASHEYHPDKNSISRFDRKNLTKMLAAVLDGCLKNE